MITAEIFRAGLVRKSWRFRFIGANNEKFGHDYNTAENAIDAVRTLLDYNIPVQLRVIEEDGTVTDMGRIR